MLSDPHGGVSNKEKGGAGREGGGESNRMSVLN